MVTNGFEQLLSPVEIGNVSLKNRIMSSGHQTSLTEDNLPTDDFIAYHYERAKGGVGLIVLEAHAAHYTAVNTPVAIDGTDPRLIDKHRELVQRLAPSGAKIFAQIFHNGSEAYTETYADPVVAPSAVPTERFHLMPRELEEFEIEEIIESFALVARNLREGGISGVELGGSHGYLFTQFWSPRTNLRTDKWGGSFENRVRFSREVMRRVKEVTGEDMALGMRISLGAEDGRGLSVEESLEVIDHLDKMNLLDYWSVVVGSSRTYEGASYIVPPASEGAGLVLDRAKRVREATGRPVMVTSRINTAVQAEQAIRQGCGDVIGMTRALIADPSLPKKLSRSDRFIIPCIAVNQGCIGRYQAHLPIRCTVNPRTGREGQLPSATPSPRPKSLLIIGGGPAGMIAALEAHKRSHRVKLVEQSSQLGGQMLCGSEVGHKQDFADWPTAIGAELENRGVEVELGRTFAAEDVAQEEFDVLIIATGSRAYVPRVPLEGSLSVFAARDVLEDKAEPQGPAMVIDWESRWSGIEAAETLAKRGLDVEIVSTSYGIAEGVQQYIRNKALARLDHMGVQMTPGYRLAGIDADKVVLRHLFSRRPVERTGFSSVILCYGGDAHNSLRLYQETSKLVPEVYRIGDALSPRTLDEAVWEGYKVVSRTLSPSQSE